MKKIDKLRRAFKEHMANCPICAQFKNIKDVEDFRRKDLLCDTGQALPGEMCDAITKDEQFMRLLRKICERKAS